MNRQGCERMEEVLQLYALGQVTADERRLVEEHLGSCPACRQTLEYIRHVDAIIAELPELPECMASRLPEIDEAVEVATGQRRPLPRWLRGRAVNLAASLAMIALVGVMALTLWSALSQVQPATTPVVVATAEPTPQPVLSQPSLGKIAFVREGDIWVKDLPDGQARRLTQVGKNDSPQWSPSGEWLAYRQGGETWAMRSSGADAHRVSSGQVDWSPIADQLAYADQGSLFVVNADGGNRRELVPRDSKDGAGVEGLAWSPDGQWIAYELLDRPGLAATLQGLYRVKADGSEVKEIYVNQDPVHTHSSWLAAWSPDSLSLLFWQNPLGMSASALAGGLPLMRVPVNGGTPSQVAPAVLHRGDMLSWSPDCQRVALVVGGKRETWESKRLAIAQPDGTLSYLNGETRADLFPSWSPDGRQLAFTSASAVQDIPGGDDAKEALAERRIWLQKEDKGQVKLTDDPAFRDERPCFSTDGSYILFARLQGDEQQLWLMKNDGSQQRLVADNLGTVPTSQDASPWFGFYGYIDWQRLYDWWQPAPKPGPSPAPIVKATPPPTPSPTPSPDTPIEYRNDQYGFGLDLPESWKGYSIQVNQWAGDALVPRQSGDVSVTIERGPMVSIRHPLWTTEEPRQDIPIMVFTVAQWNSLQKGDFHIGAAPMNPKELGRNNRYVFALPARYNYAFPEGFEEVEQILQGQPLRTFEINVAPSPFSEQYEITEVDNGKTFAYARGTEFSIVLNEERHPRENQRWSCDVEGGWNFVGLYGVPAPPPPLYRERLKAVRACECTYTNGDFSVTIKVVETPSASPTATPGQPLDGWPRVVTEMKTIPVLQPTYLPAQLADAPVKVDAGVGPHGGLDCEYYHVIYQKGDIYLEFAGLAGIGQLGEATEVGTIGLRGCTAEMLSWRRNGQPDGEIISTAVTWRERGGTASRPYPLPAGTTDFLVWGRNLPVEEVIRSADSLRSVGAVPAMGCDRGVADVTPHRD